MSQDILRKRRKWLLSGLLLTPILVVALSEAAGMPMLGGKSTFAPSSCSTEIFPIYLDHAWKAPPSA